MCDVASLGYLSMGQGSCMDDGIGMGCILFRIGHEQPPLDDRAQLASCSGDAPTAA